MDNTEYRDAFWICLLLWTVVMAPSAFITGEIYAETFHNPSVMHVTIKEK